MAVHETRDGKMQYSDKLRIADYHKPLTFATWSYLALSLIQVFPNDCSAGPVFLGMARNALASMSLFC